MGVMAASYTANCSLVGFFKSRLASEFSNEEENP